MDINYIKKEAIIETGNERKVGHNTQKATQACLKKSNKDKAEIIESGFYDENNQPISMIDHERKVVFKIKGKNLAGKHLKVDFFDQRNVVLYYMHKNNDLLEKGVLILQMKSDEVAIDLKAEFMSKTS